MPFVLNYGRRLLGTSYRSVDEAKRDYYQSADIIINPFTLIIQVAGIFFKKNRPFGKLAIVV